MLVAPSIAGKFFPTPRAKFARKLSELAGWLSNFTAIGMMASTSQVALPDPTPLTFSWVLLLKYLVGGRPAAFAFANKGLVGFLTDDVDV